MGKLKDLQGYLKRIWDAPNLPDAAKKPHIGASIIAGIVFASLSGPVAGLLVGGLVLAIRPAMGIVEDIKNKEERTKTPKQEKAIEKTAVESEERDLEIFINTYKRGMETSFKLLNSSNYKDSMFKVHNQLALAEQHLQNGESEKAMQAMEALQNFVNTLETKPPVVPQQVVEQKKVTQQRPIKQVELPSLELMREIIRINGLTDEAKFEPLITAEKLAVGLDNHMKTAIAKDPKNNSRKYRITAATRIVAQYGFRSKLDQDYTLKDSDGTLVPQAVIPKRAIQQNITEIRKTHL